MKNFNVLLTSLVVVLFMTACQKEQSDTALVEKNLTQQEQIQLQLENGELPLATVVPATLEELNAELKKHGLPTYSEEYLEQRKARASNRATADECTAAQALGDFNGDGYLTTFDIVRVLQHTLNCGFGDQIVDTNDPAEVYCNNSYYNCGGSANDLETFCPIRLVMVAFIGGSQTLVEPIDTDIMHDAILFRCTD